MPRKVKQRQKQKQKQSQTVIVNVGHTRRRQPSERSAPSAPRPPPFMPIPFPVPALRGPEPLVQSQPSLAQLIEALRPVGQAIANVPVPAPVPVPVPVPAPAAAPATPAPAPASPRPPSTLVPTAIPRPPRAAPITELVNEQKYESGPQRVVAPPSPMLKPQDPIVAASPAQPGRMVVKRPTAPPPAPPALPPAPPAPPAPSSSSSSSYVKYSDEELQKMIVRTKDKTKPGQQTLEEVAQAMNLRVPTSVRDNKQAFIAYIKRYY